MYELTVRSHFDAAHFLKNYQGKCAHIHGHTWQVEVKIRGNNLDETGMLVDFFLVKKNLRAIAGQLDHSLLNDLAFFKDINPTAENISKIIFYKMEESLKEYPVSVNSVTVWESPGAAATFIKDEEEGGE